MAWEATLSNGEIVKQDVEEVSSWRNLRDRCIKEGLKVKNITYGGEDPHPKVPISHYFILFDVYVPNVHLGGREQHVKIGIGVFYKNKQKCRIHWYPFYGKPDVYTEIIYNNIDVYKEIAVEKEDGETTE